MLRQAWNIGVAIVEAFLPEKKLRPIVTDKLFSGGKQIDLTPIPPFTAETIRAGGAACLAESDRYWAEMNRRLSAVNERRTTGISVWSKLSPVPYACPICGERAMVWVHPVNETDHPWLTCNCGVEFRVRLVKKGA